MNKLGHGGIKGWLTLDQLIDFYRSEVVARAVSEKRMENDQHHRPHPIIPEVEEAQQFYVQIEDRDKEALYNIFKRVMQNRR